MHAASTTSATSSSRVVKSSFPDVKLPRGNFVNTTFKDVAKFLDKVALECCVTGTQYTYGQLMDAIGRFGGYLLKLGVSRGDIVAIAMPNCPEYPLIFFGALAIGAAVTTVNASYTAEEIANQLEDSQAKVLVGSPFIELQLHQALQLYCKPVHLLLNGSTGSSGDITNLQEVLSDPTIPLVETVELCGDEVAVVPYSSGTTGKPKGVCLSHNALNAGLTIFSDAHVCAPKRTEGNFQEVILGLLPFSHMSGMVSVMSISLLFGAKLITMPKFDPQLYVNTLKLHKMKHLLTVPTILNFLNSEKVMKEDLTHVENIMCGAAPVPPTAIEAIKTKCGHPVFCQEGYGMTEICISHMTPLAEERTGSCGKLLANVIAKVRNLDSGEHQPPNCVGEICIKSPAVMTGYLNRPDATAETIDSEGWLHTGDVGFYDDEGFFKIVGRTKELIKVKGFQVSPSEVEDVILQLPGVQDVGVVGVPHPKLGEAPRAYVVCKQPLQDSEIHKFLESRLAAYKHLSGGVAFVSQLPRNPAGKLLRQKLKIMTAE